MRAPGAFGVPLFRALWTAALVSNFGTLMHATAAAWLMTSLTDSPLIVGLVQTATSAPALLVGLPGGVLADTLDRRRWLMVTQGLMLVATFALGVLTLLGKVNAASLLALTFLLGIGMALNLPAWQALVQDVVDRDRVASAVSLNSISFNLARSVGPAAGGWATGVLGPGVVFLANSVSFLGMIGVLAGWRRPVPERKPRRPMRAALAEGARFVWSEPRVRSAMARSAMFVLCASSVGALLPLLARDELGLTAQGYGTLLALYGAGSVAGALALPWLRGRLGVQRMVGLANGCYAIALAGLAIAPSEWTAAATLALAGVCWSGMMVNLNVTVQMAAPEGIRGRAMSYYLLTFQGAFAVGGVVAGGLASAIGLRAALGACAGGMLLGWAARGWFPLAEED